MPTINMIATGENITTLRVNAGLSVRELQDIFGFGSANTIYKWQRGESMPTVDNLVILANLFSTTIDNILIVA